MRLRPGLAAFLGGFGAICFTHGCSSEEEKGFVPKCAPLQFRACLNPEGKQGLEQCVEPGVWGGCVPSVYGDAAYADVESGAKDAADVDEASDSSDDADAQDAADASEDGEADAEDAGLLDSSE